MRKDLPGNPTFFCGNIETQNHLFLTSSMAKSVCRGGCWVLVYEQILVLQTFGKVWHGSMLISLMTRKLYFVNCCHMLVYLDNKK
jgi:hypothetical protein